MEFGTSASLQTLLQAPARWCLLQSEEPYTFEIGTESESTLLVNNSNLLVEVSNDLVIEVDVKDIAAFFSEAPLGLEDMQNISQAGVEFFWTQMGQTPHWEHLRPTVKACDSDMDSSTTAGAGLLRCVDGHV